MLARVEIHRVTDNPFQSRLDYEGVEELARAILKMREARPETSGLIQTPVARIVLGGRVLDPAEYGGVEACLGDEPKAWIQLAAGHRRKRAFALLRADDVDYDKLPVDVQVLSDEDMATLAWQENMERKDLSPMEKARALRAAIERFGWTQSEVGQKWGLTQAAVSNTLRLLNLPDEAQDAIQAGVLTARHGRLLLSAMGKSPAIGRRAIEELVPVAVAPEAAAKAKELVETWNFYSGFEAPGAGALCAGCGQPFDGGRVWMRGRVDGSWVFLCQPCYRAGSGWQPPSVAEAERELRRIVRGERKRLGEWPLDVVVGDGNPLVHYATCEECAYWERDGVTCLDRSCFEAKQEHWRSYQADRVRAQMRARFPKSPPLQIVYDWGGHDLRAVSDTDRAMVESGHCSPACERFRLRYISYDSSSNLYLVDGFPFVVNCNHTNSCNVCRRKFEKAQQPPEETEAEKEEKRLVAERKKAARAYLKRCEVSYARALMDAHQGAWCDLVKTVGGRPENGQPVEASALQVAKARLDGNRWMRFMDWAFKGADERFEENMRGHLERAGVGLMPGLEDIRAKIGKVKALFDGGGFDGELTEEMIAGNIVNLDKLVVALGDLAEAGLVTAVEEEALAAEALEVQQWLTERMNGEDWLISWEIDRAA